MKKFLHYSLLVLSCGALMLAACSNKQVPVSSEEPASSESEEPGPGPEPGPEPEPAETYEVPLYLEDAKYFKFDDVEMINFDLEVLVDSTFYNITAINKIEEFIPYYDPSTETTVIISEESEYQLYSNNFYSVSKEMIQRGQSYGLNIQMIEEQSQTYGYVEVTETAAYGVSETLSYDYYYDRLYDVWNATNLGLDVTDEDEMAFASVVACGAENLIGNDVFSTFYPMCYTVIGDSLLVISSSISAATKTAHQYGEDLAPEFYYLERTKNQQILEFDLVKEEVKSFYKFYEKTSDHDLMTGALLAEEQRIDAEMLVHFYNSDPLKPFSGETQFRESVPTYAATETALYMDVYAATVNEEGELTAVDSTPDVYDYGNNDGYLNPLTFMKDYVITQSALGKANAKVAIQFRTVVDWVCLKGEHIGETGQQSNTYADENCNAYPQSKVQTLGEGDEAKSYILADLNNLDNYYELTVSLSMDAEAKESLGLFTMSYNANLA